MTDDLSRETQDGREGCAIDRMAEALYRADDHPPGPPGPPLFAAGFGGPLWERSREKYRRMALAAHRALSEQKDTDHD